MNPLSAKLIFQGKVQGHLQGPGRNQSQGQSLGQEHLQGQGQSLGEGSVQGHGRGQGQCLCMWLYVPLASPEDCLLTAPLAPLTGLIR